jgi:rod shape-determining protein MreB
MAGGGSLLRGLAERIADEVKLRDWVAEDSMTCVARGAGAILEDLDNLRKVLVSRDRGSTQH